MRLGTMFSARSSPSTNRNTQAKPAGHEGERQARHQQHQQAAEHDEGQPLDSDIQPHQSLASRMCSAAPCGSIKRAEVLRMNCPDMLRRLADALQHQQQAAHAP
jgi:hypothetical protein